MQNKQTIDSIQNKVFNKGKNTESDKFIRLCEIMEVCGGYSKFLETPCAVLMEIDLMINKRQEDQDKMLNKLFGKSKK
jgi:hypothetical protein